MTKRVDGLDGASGGGKGEELKKWKTRREFLHLGELDFKERENGEGEKEGDVVLEVEGEVVRGEETFEN